MIEDLRVRVLLLTQDDKCARFLETGFSNLESFRLSLTDARSCEEVLQQVRSAVFDVVVVDLACPGEEHSAVIRGCLELDRHAAVFGLMSRYDEGLVANVIRLGAFGCFATSDTDSRFVANQICAASGRRQNHLQQTRRSYSERFAAIGQLVAGIAHEINNPASYALANAMVLEERVDEFRKKLSSDGEEDPSRNRQALPILSEIQEMASSCAEGVGRISKAVQKLAAFAPLKRDNVKMIQVNDLVGPACDAIEQEFGARIHVSRTLSELPCFFGEPAELSLLFRHVLRNAAEATSSSSAGKNIDVTTCIEEENVLVLVRDEGHGVPDSLRGRIFEPFCTTRGLGSARGLGLTVGTTIALKHAGEVELLGSTEHGSTFQIRLPVENGLQTQDDKVPQPSPGSARERTRLLVVDDEPRLVRAFQRILGRKYDVVGCEGGSVAVNLLEEDRMFDAIICDLMMPDVDGAEVHRFVQNLDVALASRMVFCSGGAFTERTRKFVASIPNICLEKPFAWIY